MRSLRLPLLFALWLAACGGVDAFLDGGEEPDASVDLADSGLGDDAGATDDAGTPDAGPAAPDSGCPDEMARILGYCVDRWEAHVVEVLSDGGTQPHSPFTVIAGKTVAARSRASACARRTSSPAPAAAPTRAPRTPTAALPASPAPATKGRGA